MRKILVPQFNLYSLLISGIVTYYLWFYFDKIETDDIKQAINSVITLLSISFGIYGVSMSVIAGLHDTELVQLLLRSGSKSKSELKNRNIDVLYTTLFSVFFMILFQTIYTSISSNEWLFLIFIAIAICTIVTSIKAVASFFLLISSVLFG